MGHSGYFYISYYDCSAAITSNGGENAVFMDAEPTNNYLHNYQYDPLGWVTQIGNEETTTFWGANVFTATANEDVAAVGLYAVQPGVSCQISIYTSPTNGPITTSGPAITMSETLPNMGFFTVPLTKLVPLKTGERFSVAVEFTEPGSPITTGPDTNTYPIAAQTPVAGYSSQATASPVKVITAGTGWTGMM